MANDSTARPVPASGIAGISGVAHGTVVMPEEVARLAAEAEAEDSDDGVS
jgi:hypothetical protein